MCSTHASSSSLSNRTARPCRPANRCIPPPCGRIPKSQKPWEQLDHAACTAGRFSIKRHFVAHELLQMTVTIFTIVTVRGPTVTVVIFVTKISMKSWKYEACCRVSYGPISLSLCLQDSEHHSGVQVHYKDASLIFFDQLRLKAAFAVHKVDNRPGNR